MRFQCLTCTKPFGWTAKKTVSKIIEGYDLPVTMEYIVCPYCEGFDFEEGNSVIQKKLKEVPHVQMPKSVQMKSPFDPADLMQHSWKKGKRRPDGKYDVGSLAYGWDFATEFKPETVQELKIQGTIAVSDYEFSIDQAMKFVRVKKVTR